jgi:plastocyanin
MIKIFTTFFTALVLIAVSHAADITGIITFKGTPPPESPYDPLMENSDCAAMYKETPTTHFFVVSKNGGFADVILSLKDASGKEIIGKSTGASASAVTLDQKGCLYSPTILAIQTGQKLIVKNSDQCIHNVHTISKNGNTDHNDAQMAGGADLTYTFDKPEMFLKFQCDVHPWMFAWVSIFDSPYFAVSDKDGKFTIKNVPPGKYTIEANHRKLGAQTQTIEVADKNGTANFTFAAK